MQEGIVRDMYGNDLRKTDSFGTPRGDWAPVIRCPVCGSDDLDGAPVDDGVEMPDPVNEDNALIGYSVVAFRCQACGHRWIDGESDPATGDGDGGQGDHQ